MREEGTWVRCRVKYRLTTNGCYRHPVFPNRLERNFRTERSNQAGAGDISYVWTHEVWLDLSVVSDLYFRKIVRWSMSHLITSRLFYDAPQMAI